MELSWVVNIAGAALFALVGLGVLVVGRGTRRGVLVGAMATLFGLVWVFQNLSAHHALARIALSMTAFLGAVAGVLLAGEVSKEASAAGRRWVGWLAILLILAVIGFSALLLSASGGVTFRWAFQTAYRAFLVVLILLLGTVAAAFQEARGDRAGLACLALAFGPFVAFLWAAFAASQGFGNVVLGRGHDALLLVLGGMTAAAIVPFASGRRGMDRLSRSVFPALVLAGAAGVVLVAATGPDYSEDFGSFGVVRTLGAFFLVLAVVRYDLLGVPLPRFAVRRGTLATAALAVVFVVAEIAQNFFAAEYGLLMGGLVAGGKILAADPIQRTLGRGGTGSGAAYRAAVRAALADGGMSAAKEEHLADVAEHLGLGPREALRLRRQAEQEPDV